MFPALLLAAAAGAQNPAADPADLVQQGQALTRLGKMDEALNLYRNALQLAPDSFPANDAAGVALDLTGEYAEARKHFAKAIQAAPSPANKIRALRDMALSYAFEGNCKAAVPHDQQAYDLELAAKDFYNAGEVADELARICIDSGDLDAAAKWYRAGYEAGLREPDIQPARKHLWEFRWEHAQARIAARRGDKAEAEKRVAAAKAALAHGDNGQQQQFLPYLLGYVAFYAGDYKTALDGFQDANQNDPFILAMMAQADEKLGKKGEAADLYRRILTFSAHNPPVAYARPLAKKKLGRS
ncbi:MAG: tetratricopeptide repeat protein [Acidobacteriia bacterium]|nr:tetratricopeptide repeat protein [Terriglobia bacterium]